MTPDLIGDTGGTDTAVIGDTESGTVVPRVWVVRADGGKYADHFVTGGYAAVGWFDLSSVDTRDQLREIYELKYPDAPAGKVANEIGQLAAFRLEMGEGDYLITPAANRESLRYGRIVGPCVAFKGDDGCRYLKRRAVAWAEALLSRSSLGESFQRTLGSPRTVFCVSHPEEFLDRENREATVVRELAEPVGEVAIPLPAQPRDSMRRDIVEEAFRNIEAPEVLAAVQQPVGVGRIAARLELPEPDEPRHAGVDRLFEQMLKVAPKPGRDPLGDAGFDLAFRVDQRVGAEPLDRRRGRQDGSRAMTGLDEPAHQILVRLRPSRLSAVQKVREVKHRFF